MTNYARLSEKPLPFLSLTAYTVAEFQALLPTFRTAFLRQMQQKTLDAKNREKRRFVAYRNSPLPTMEDKLLFILMYLRKATTQDIFGEVFQRAVIFIKIQDFKGMARRMSRSSNR